MHTTERYLIIIDKKNRYFKYRIVFFYKSGFPTSWGPYAEPILDHFIEDNLGFGQYLKLSKEDWAILEKLATCTEHKIDLINCFCRNKSKQISKIIYADDALGLSINDATTVEINIT